VRIQSGKQHDHKVRPAHTLPHRWICLFLVHGGITCAVDVPLITLAGFKFITQVLTFITFFSCCAPRSLDWRGGRHGRIFNRGPKRFWQVAIQVAFVRLGADQRP
jgi:hypothetical protein